ncbi:MAG: DUF3119 family protein [Planktothrix sp.]|uniref:DUF3119 family protein n=1 Tax=Planktothrix sp. TaxID=3088171 RepID=UPI0038D48580
MTTTPTTQTPNTIELPPNYIIPIVLMISAFPLFLIQRWGSLALAFFALFLFIQTALIRLQFTPTDLDVYRSGKLIRRFPYQEWSNWEIFWTPVPILFYFREVKSIHFLPIIFDAQLLQSCLKQYCGHLKQN